MYTSTHSRFAKIVVTHRLLMTFSDVDRGVIGRDYVLLHDSAGGLRSLGVPAVVNLVVPDRKFCRTWCDGPDGVEFVHLTPGDAGGRSNSP